MASLANAGNARGWLVDAYELHGVAIRRISAALMDLEHVKSDQTLAAVMLMGTFEVLYSPQLTSPACTLIFSSARMSSVKMEAQCTISP